jgi:hypothetical protein
MVGYLPSKVFSRTSGFQAKMRLLSGLLSTLVLLGVVSAAPTPRDTELPIVDLGYVQQQATEYNETADVYVYRNIRFAAPPLGDLRLKKPQDPLNETEIQNGSLGRSTACSQTDGTSLIGSEDCLVRWKCVCLVELADDMGLYLVPGCLRSGVVEWKCPGLGLVRMLLKFYYGVGNNIGLGGMEAGLRLVPKMKMEAHGASTPSPANHLFSFPRTTDWVPSGLLLLRIAM